MSSKDKVDLIRLIIITEFMNAFMYVSHVTFECTTICKNKQNTNQYLLKPPDKFSNCGVKIKEHQGVSTSQPGLYLVLAGWRMIDLASGNYRITHHFGTFY